MRCRPAGTCGQLLSVTEQLSIAIDFLQEKVRNRACVDGMAEDDDTGICGCARSPIPNRSPPHQQNTDPTSAHRLGVHEPAVRRVR